MIIKKKVKELSSLISEIFTHRMNESEEFQLLHHFTTGQDHHDNETSGH
jgi:hypothetical protein